MRGAGSIVALVAASGTACVHVNRRAVVSEDVVARTEVLGDEVDVRWTGSVRAGDHAFEIRVAGERTCRRLSEQKVTRRTTIERSPDGLMLGTSIVAGLALGALGAVFLYDHREGTDVEPVLYRGDLDVGRGTGIALLATGALSLSGAAIAGMRSRDEVRDEATPSVRRVPIEGTVACGAAPASGVQITLGRGELAVPAGTTDPSGQLAIPYAALPETLVAQAEPASVRVSATTGKHTFVVGDVALTLPRQVRLATAWRDAETGGDPERFERYAQLDPARAVEALARARALRTERVTARLAARDATAASADLEALRQRHTQGADVDALARKHEALRSELQAEERARQRESVLTALATAVAAVQGGGASADAFQAAHTQLEHARSAYVGEPKVSELAAVLETARAARVKTLIAESQRHLRASAFEPARRTAHEAELVAPGDPRVQRAVKAVDDRERAASERERTANLKARVAMARKLSRAGDFISARRAVENARTLHGDDPKLAAVNAAIDKAEVNAMVRDATKAVAAKRYDDAAKAVERGLQLAPDDRRLARLLERVRKARGAAQQSRTDHVH